MKTINLTLTHAEAMSLWQAVEIADRHREEMDKENAGPLRWGTERLQRLMAESVETLAAPQPEPAAKCTASQLRAGHVLRIGNGIAYPVVSMGLPFICDGTVRIKLQGIDYSLIINEKAPVELVG